MTNMNINIRARHIQFEKDQIEVDAGTFHLIADVPHVISIDPGCFANVPTPIHLQGDGQTFAIMHVRAGRPDDDPTIGMVGQFIAPPEDGEIMVVAKVINETAATVMIRPGNSVGTIEFGRIASSRSDHVESSADVQISAIYRPQHIASEQAPSYETDGASAIDLKADIASSLVIAPGARATVPTALYLAIPQGLEGQVRPRSGLALKHGITIVNSPGTIDADYRGEIRVVLHNLGDADFEVTPGARIAQLAFTPVVRAAFDFVDSLDETSRGQGGFGSTGR